MGDSAQSAQQDANSAAGQAGKIQQRDSKLSRVSKNSSNAVSDLALTLQTGKKQLSSQPASRLAVAENKPVIGIGMAIKEV